MKNLNSILIAVGLGTMMAAPAFAQGTAFTYQGRLNSGANVANGKYDLAFTLYTTNATGTPIAGPVTNTAVPVTNGLFTTLVNFTNGFSGGSNWLQVAVSSNGLNAFNALLPRQQLTPVPYAVLASSVSGLTIQPNADSPNVILGFSGNSVTGGGEGNVIGGGGANNPGLLLTPNITSGNFDVIGGGYANTALGSASAIGGGYNNSAGPGSVTGGEVVGGGYDNNASGDAAAILGGEQNIASGDLSVVGGGIYNTASGKGAVVSGGGWDGLAAYGNTASGNASVVGGGMNNNASGAYATVPGGTNNSAAGNFSFAAGQHAQALHQGAFVWADSQNAAFASTANDQFLIRARGGVGIGTTNPADALDIVGPAGTRTIVQSTGSSYAGFLSENSQANWFMGNDPVQGYGTWEVYEDSPFAGPRLIINTNGNVGIGTSTPATTLQVNGTVTASNFVGTVSAAELMSIGNGNSGSIDNVFAGPAGNATMTGSYNTGIGGSALEVDTTGAYNTAMGFDSMVSNKTGIYNTAYGLSSLYHNNSGVDNTAIGVGALFSSTNGGNNVAVGYSALYALGDSAALGQGSNNVALGFNTAYDFESGNNDIFLGYQAGYNLNIGNNDIYLGNQGTGTGFSSSENNIIRLGTEGMQTDTYLAGVVHGNGSGLTNFYASQLTSVGNGNSGSANNYFDGPAGNSTMTGSYNTGIGGNALEGDTTGAYNTAMGFDSMVSNKTGIYNTAYGLSSLYHNNSGVDNTAIGVGALFNSTNGGNNVAVGYSALYALGDSAALGQGSNNVALGFNTAFDFESGNNDIFLGYQAGYNLNIGNNDIYIGNQGTGTGFSSAENNITRIGTEGTQTDTYVAGVAHFTTGSVGIGTTPVGHLSVATANGTLNVMDGQFTPELVMTGGPADGALRLRNRLEIWPKTNLTAAGYLDIRATNGTATISLDGTNGSVAATYLRSPGQGINSGTFAFIQRAVATNTSGNITTIYNPICNGDPNAILIVTHNWSSDTNSTSSYNTKPVGVYYAAPNWTIFNEDLSAMALGRAFNVMVIKP